MHVRTCVHGWTHIPLPPPPHMLSVQVGRVPRTPLPPHPPTGRPTRHHLATRRPRDPPPLPPWPHAWDSKDSNGHMLSNLRHSICCPCKRFPPPFHKKSLRHVPRIPLPHPSSLPHPVAASGPPSFRPPIPRPRPPPLALRPPQARPWCSTTPSCISSA